MRATKHNRIHRPIILLMSALLLSSCQMRQCIIYCHDGTEVQRVYVNARNDCQNLAEDKVHLFLDDGPGGGPKQVNSALLALFAKCMHIKDWGVTAPKQETKQPIPASQANNGTRARAGVGLAPGYSDQPPAYPAPQNFRFPQPAPYPNGRY